jgi:hypothetical protein
MTLWMSAGWFAEPRMVPRVQSNAVVCWWAFLVLVSIANVALWFLLYRAFHAQPTDGRGTPEIEFMMLLSSAYVFGCAFRSLLPRADVQRICLFDTWLSSVLVGRSVATVAEVCFACQWGLLLAQLGGIAGDVATQSIAWAIVPLIVAAQYCSWYGVLTTNYLATAIENSIWAVAFLAVAIGLCRVLPDFYGHVRLALVVGVAGIASYLAFLATVDVPMYLRRWRAGRASGHKLMRPLEGLRDVRKRWIVTHDFAQWKHEIPWMSLYFTGAVWGSLALCVVTYSIGHHLPV